MASAGENTKKKTVFLIHRPLGCFIILENRERPLDSKTRTTTRPRFYEYLVVRTREPASFWRENAVAVRRA